MQKLHVLGQGYLSRRQHVFDRLDLLDRLAAETANEQKNVTATMPAKTAVPKAAQDRPPPLGRDPVALPRPPAEPGTL